MAHSITIKAAIAGGMAAALIAGSAQAQDKAKGDTEKFFAGKSVDFLIGSAPGGGYGIYAALLSRHIGKHLPGQPSVVARNNPGAGSLVAANLLYNKMPKDGSVFGAIFMGAVMEPLIGDKSATQFDPRKFEFIGSANRETSICVAWHTSPIKTFDDMFDKELIVGTSGVTSSIQQYPTVLNNVLHTKFKIVSGYPGSREAALAMERGETGGICGLQWSSFITNYQSWLDEKKVRIIAQISSEGGDPVLNKMGVPTIWKYVEVGCRQEDPEGHLQPARIRPALHPASGRARRPRRGLSQGLRRDDEGSRVSRRSQEDEARHRSAFGRGSPEGRRRDLFDSAGRRRPRARRPEIVAAAAK